MLRSVLDLLLRESNDFNIALVCKKKPIEYESITDLISFRSQNSIGKVFFAHFDRMQACRYKQQQSMRQDQSKSINIQLYEDIRQLGDNASREPYA